MPAFESPGGCGLKKDEIVVGIVIFLFGMLTAFLALGMPIGTFRTSGTGMFPLVLGILLMSLSGIFVLKSLFPDRKGPLNKETSIGCSGTPKPLLLFLGTMVFTALFFIRLGYPLTSFLLMGALLRILGMNRWGLNVLISAATAAGSYVLFVKWLDIPMPKGWIGL